MRALLPIILLLLAGCSNLPVAIKNPPKPDWQLAEVAANTESHQGDPIRWGGQIAKVDNDDKGSTLHIVQFPLNSYARPNDSEKSQGRFLARSSEFYDPQIYRSGTLVTIVGRVTAAKAITIDQKTMTVPVVNISEIFRWTAQPHYHDPYWYGYPYYYDRFGYGVSYPHWRSHWYYGRGYYW